MSPLLVATPIYCLLHPQAQCYAKFGFCIADSAHPFPLTSDGGRSFDAAGESSTTLFCKVCVVCATIPLEQHDAHFFFNVVRAQQKVTMPAHVFQRLNNMAHVSVQPQQKVPMMVYVLHLNAGPQQQGTRVTGSSSPGCCFLRIWEGGAGVCCHVLVQSAAWFWGQHTLFHNSRSKLT